MKFAEQLATYLANGGEITECPPALNGLNSAPAQFSDLAHGDDSTEARNKFFHAITETE